MSVARPEGEHGAHGEPDSPARPEVAGEEDPDYRFSLANERTFLAWVRTALALMASGVAVIRFVPGHVVISYALGFLLILLGAVMNAASYRHWVRNEMAMRRKEQLPPSWIPRLVTVSLTIAALVALALVISQQV